jgi:alkanesulfonate monooxygenase SsuD/methylene tetrahydromethanopterin reductase-like flavin-dependent oxidoreductase (luciferase family)
MKIGINILNYGPGTNPTTLLHWAQFSASAGYHFVMINDHLVITEDVQQFYGDSFYDPLLSLNWLAPQVPTLEMVPV